LEQWLLYLGLLLNKNNKNDYKEKKYSNEYQYVNN